MTKYFCDKCGEEIQPEKRKKLCMRWSRFLSVKCVDWEDNGVYLTICENCVKSFNKWLFERGEAK